MWTEADRIDTPYVEVVFFWCGRFCFSILVKCVTKENAETKIVWNFGFGKIEPNLICMPFVRVF